MSGARAWCGHVGNVWGLVLLLAAWLSGCGGDEPLSNPRPEFGTAEFGDACEQTEDCASGLCVQVGEMAGACSKACLSSADCPDAPNWACVADTMVDVRVCACRGVGGAEVCGDQFDNDCDGVADDCRICNGRAVADNDPDHCRRCDNRCRADQTCASSGCACSGDTPDECGGACTDRETDTENCGECGTICGAAQRCVQGVCTCPAATPDACAGACVDLEDDALNCGDCGTTCGPGLICAEGQCGCPDPTRPDVCGSAGCRDLESDPLFCGACDVTCRSGEVCDAGECVCPGGSDSTFCEAFGCTDLSNDADNCGACGNACTLGTSCVAGECVCVDAGNPDFCEGIGCVNHGFSERHCGACDRACEIGQVCSYGSCECEPGLADCGAGCVSLEFDSEHCGVCGNTCGAGQTCSNGECTCTGAGLTLCDGECVDTLVDEQNCLGCGIACGEGQTCDEFGCYCDARECNGACRPWDDPSNCGACGNACEGSQYCDGQYCRCEGSGLVACGATCDDLYTSEANCGTCGNACRPGEVCNFGYCACPSGQSFCANVGRCVNLTNDATSCGQCGRTCRPSEICSSGYCSCSAWDEAFCASENQCVSLYTNAEHCGACDHACNPGERCSGGQCTCPDGNELFCASQGACVSIVDNAEHCGACDTACPAGTHCASTTCTCDDGVSTICPDGCADLDDDEASCGTCGAACAGNELCVDGVCRCPGPVVGAAVRLTNHELDDSRPSAAWDGTHVGVAYVRFSHATFTGELRFALLTPEGAVVSDVNVSGTFGASNQYHNSRPTLVWSGTEYALTWYTSVSSRFLRLDAAGVPKGPAVEVAPNIGSTLAWSPAYAGYAVGFAGHYGSYAFRRLGVDASAPEALNQFIPLSGVSNTANLALLAMPNGGFTFAYRETRGLGFAVFNPDGSRTLPLTLLSGSEGDANGGRWPAMILHGGVIYTSHLSPSANRIHLNRGTQENSAILRELPLGSSLTYTDATIVTVRDSLALGFLEKDRLLRTGRYRFARFALPATGNIEALHDPIDIESAGTVGANETSLIATTADSMLAVWADERWGGAKELYAAPISVGACP